MKIAYLITAYIDAPQLRRLIISLIPSENQGRADFFIHIDKKVDITPFKSALQSVDANIIFTKTRFWINWGGFNQVLAYKELLSEALQRDVYNRYICLSATDYPLWSNKKIIEEFTRNSEKEYVGAYSIENSTDFQQIQKVKYYHFFRDLQLPLRLKRIICFVSRRLMRILPFRKPLSFVGSNGTLYHTYTGSDYWGITHNLAVHALKVMENDEKFMKYFSTSYIPSENVLPTIAMNSPFSSNVSIVNTDEKYPELEALTPLQYTSYKGTIKVYTIDDWDELMETDRMFFRKARTGVSDSLLDRLDSRRRNK